MYTHICAARPAGLARLFTENVPQSLLQGLFVKEAPVRVFPFAR